MTTARQPDRTRGAILHAAFESIYRDGFRSASINHILEHTGLTKGAFYHHFPTKRDLGYAILDEMLEEAVRRRFLDPLHSAGDPIEVLLENMRWNFASLSDEEVNLGCPVNNLAQEMSPHDPGFQSRIDRIYHFWCEGYEEWLRAAQKAGKVRAAVDVRDAAAFIVAALAGIRGLAKSTRSSAIMQRAQRGLEEYIASLRA